MTTWTIEYDNDVAPGDVSFREWWTVSDGHRIYNCASEASANALCNSLNFIESLSPINMLLFCPKCGTQHIDKPEQPPMAYALGMVSSASKPIWTNPPHRSHLCHACGCIWRPADVPTNGVAKIETAGKGDNWRP